MSLRIPTQETVCLVDRLLAGLNVRRFLIALLLAIFPSGFSSVSLDETKSRAIEIDERIQNTLDTNGLERTASVGDAQFARRVYLDVIGRIPTYEELSDFLRSEQSAKRSLLIDDLLDSKGYASHFYNYWEDVLRVQSKKQKSIMVSYQDWIKRALEENMPYDEFVTSLVTADGYVWENGASGYYLRDAGMPLDNMSNTAQVFLGTRMQCAQCHDHPFDSWTQKEYYHMAAYTFGLQTTGKNYRKSPVYKEFQKVAREAFREEFRSKGESPKNRKNFRSAFTKAQKRAVRDVFEPLGLEVTETNEKLRLPDDYGYKNGNAGQLVDPETPFGEEAIVSRKADPRDAYASWMTSPENPRFKTVVANRLWKKVLGYGLIEPVDNMKEDTQPNDPELMEYLEEMMVSYGFDMKQYLRTILNTRTYQSKAVAEIPEPGEPYRNQGPALRRMSAEQLWDSVLTLAVPNLDSRSGGDRQLEKLRERELALKNHVETIGDLDGTKLYKIVKYIGELEKKFILTESELKSRQNEATSEQEKQQARRELLKIRKMKSELMEQALAAVSGKNAEVSPAEAIMGEENSMEGKGERKKKKGNQLVRASEVVSPVPAGHFLRQFGESDRGIIESSHDEAAIPQALTLLNGPVVKWVTSRESALSLSVNQVDGKSSKQDIVFLSFFGRQPTDTERKLASEQIETHGNKRGYRNLITALLNTQEFRFIQ